MVVKNTLNNSDGRDFNHVYHSFVSHFDRRPRMRVELDLQRKRVEMKRQLIC